MIRKISINQYRKLKEMDLEFSSDLNIISGANGTCKTSILHMISNSFQTVTKKDDRLSNFDCIDVIKNINTVTNPKIEKLTRGDKEYNDPAKGVKGVLYNVEYGNDVEIGFRRHNSTKSHRFSIKPQYAPGLKQTLPSCPVVYLGLTRLFPIGEIDDMTEIKKISKKLPSEYIEKITEVYKELTGICIRQSFFENIPKLKKRVDFRSDQSGIDSNTISAGEDNILTILVALVSLSYYSDSLIKKEQTNSILIIDEIDATLHPSVQFKLLKILKKYAESYGIQMFFTSHSIPLIEEALKSHNKVIYFIDNITDINKLQDVDIYKIKMHLYKIAQTEMYKDKKIPIFTEDDEARFFLDLILDYFCEKYTDIDFRKIKSFLSLINVNFGSDNLKKLFNDITFKKSNFNSICILDGDQDDDLNNNIITLPGDDSPEKIIFSHAKKLYEEDEDFWKESDIVEKGFTRTYFRDDVLMDIQNIEKKLKRIIASGKSTKGVEREECKKVFNKHKQFFDYIIINWINSDLNKISVEKFYNSLFSMFRKVANSNSINPNEWGK